MNTRFSFSFSILFLLFTSVVSAQYIQVNDNYTAQQLVEDVLIGSSCAQVSNISVSGGIYNSGNTFGYFSGAGTSFPFSSGVILSTGRAVGAQGPNTSLLDDGGGMNWNGDQDLEEALSINNSVNATVLEFDFVPLGNRISFDYMLSSEEYHDNAPCQYSDGFAFLLKEVGSPEPYDNLAVVPGTFIPVKVTSVHPQIGGNNGCSAQNEEYFGGFNGSNHPTNFNGQTAVLQARANVTPGTLYHIKLVIADEGNYRYDSAIFLGAGSFDVETDLGPDRLVATNNPLCPGESITLDATNPNAIGYTWYKDGILQTGSGPTFNAAAAGTYSVEVQLTQTCISEGGIVLEYGSVPPPGNETLLQCDENNDGLTVFNLNLANPLVTGNNPDLTVNYFLTQADADAGTNPVANTSQFENTIVNQQVYARVSNQFGCHSVSTVTLSTSANGLTDPAPLENCDTDGTDDGFSVFDLTTKDAEILGALPAGLHLQYFTTVLDAFTATNPIADPSTFANTTANSQTVYSRIYSGSECYGIAELELIVHSFGPGFQDEQAVICKDEVAVLSIPSGFTTYSWDTDPVQTTPAIVVDEPGIYSVTVTNADGCEATKTFTVIPSGPAENAIIEVNDFTGTNNSIVIEPEGLGSYEFSIDGNTYFDNPVFSNLVPGEYTVHIRDKNGCGPVFTDVVYILDYPKFFTPNGDGVNDIWRIPYLDQYPSAVVNIYDRFGKVVGGFTGSTNGWNGIFKGKNLPSTDYWFVIQMPNGKIIKGHFAMIR